MDIDEDHNPRWLPKKNPSAAWFSQLTRRIKAKRLLVTWTLLLAIYWLLGTNRYRPISVTEKDLVDGGKFHVQKIDFEKPREHGPLKREDEHEASAQKPLSDSIEQESSHVVDDNPDPSETSIVTAETVHTESQDEQQGKNLTTYRDKQDVTLPGENTHNQAVSETSLESEQHISLETLAETLPDFVFVPFEESIREMKLDGWEDRWISDAEFDTDEHGRLAEPKIDFVYLWVNGSDEEFRATMLPWELKSVLNDPEGAWMASHGVNRYRDWDELRYSFRSINRNAGHFRNNLQIVVNSIGESPASKGAFNRQTPSWLRDADKHNVQVIAQEEFFEQNRAACLPTFNSLTIENQLFNLPSNVDHFFALSDDMLLGARHSPSDIYSPLFGPVMGFKTNSYSTVQPPSEADAKRFGEKPYLIYTSWLLNRRFGIRKRKGQGHFGHSLSRSVMKEAIRSFPKPELQSACKRFRGEPGFQLYSWYLSFHYLIERYREALLWSYLMLRSDVDGDGLLSWLERQQVVDDIRNGTANIGKSSFRRRNFYHAPAALEKAGLEPPQVNTNIQWTSMDGPVSIQNADCSDFDTDDCLGPGFAYANSSTGNPLFSSANVFDRAARQNPHCGDCLIKILLHQVRQGLSPLLPSKGSQDDKREMVVKALMRYKYTIMDPTNSLFVMVTDADQVDSTLVSKYIRDGKQLPGQICLNDDVSTTDEQELSDTHQAMSELLEGILPEKAPWEK